MPNDVQTDPLEGKGEEMIPERGLPFDDIEETPLEDIPPEERIPDTIEEDFFSNEELADSEDSGAALTADETSSEVEFDTEDAEALVGDAGEAFADLEAIPWEMEEEAVEAFIDDAGEAFEPAEAFAPPQEDRSLPGPPDEPPLTEDFETPPEDLVDAGMATHLEDDPAVIEKLFSEAAFQPPGPQAPAAPAVTQPKQTVDESMLDLLVTDDDIQALWRRASEAQRNIPRIITTDYIATQLMDRIQTARNLLIAGRENYEEAERQISEVEYRLQLSSNLKKLGKTAIPQLYAYLALWFVGLVVGLFSLGETAFSAEGGLFILLAGSMIWGGLGGVVGALLPLIKHFSVKQDYSTQHTWWYLSSPLVGAAMGAFVHLMLSAGLLSLSSGNLSSPLVIYIFAGLAGYQHNVFTDLIKRLLKVLAVSESKTESAEK